MRNYKFSISVFCRKEIFEKFIKSLTDNAEAMKHWHEWGLTFDRQILELKGRVLPSPTLYFGNNYQERVQKADWARAAGSKPVLTPMAFDKWAVIYNSKNSDQALKNLKDGLMNCSKKLGISLKAPKVIEIKDDRSDTMIKVIRDLPDGCQLVVPIFGGPMRADRYFPPFYLSKTTYRKTSNNVLPLIIPAPLKFLKKYHVPLIMYAL